MARDRKLADGWGTTALLGVAYFLAAAGTVSATRFEGGVAFVWLATAPLLAMLCTLPPARWRRPLFACAIAIVLTTATVGLGLRGAPFMVCSNLGEAVIGALLLRRCGHQDDYLESVTGVARLLLIAGLIAPTVTGLLGATAASLLGNASLVSNFVHWVAGHGLGTVAATPVATLAVRGELVAWHRQATTRELLRLLAVFAAVFATALFTFLQSHAPILFLPILPMIGATVLLGRLGAAGSTLILLGVGGSLSLRGYGPVHLMQATPGDQVLFFQFYLACATATVLPVAALLKQHKLLVLRLSESEAKYRLISERSSDPILEVSPNGTILFVSGAARAVMGCDPAALVGTDARALTHPDDLPELWRAHDRALFCPEGVQVAQFRAAQAPQRWFEVAIRAVPSPEGGPASVIGSVRDVTERKTAEQALAVAAATDPLTGLANRRALLDAVARAVTAVEQGGAPACLALFDLDHFKQVNDRHGHAAGDVALQVFVARAIAALRATDLVGRIGGEEFAALLPGTTVAEAQAACERVCHAMRDAPVTLPGGATLTVTVSIGLVALARGRDAAAVLRAADEALYDAKHAGRNCLRLAA